MFLIGTRVGPSAIHGNGVFACEDVAAGAIIWRFHPPFDRVISDESLGGLPSAARAHIETYAYRAADLDGQLVMPGDDARFLNHDDHPNTAEEPFASMAVRPILAGDEITCDYGRFCVGWTGFGDGAAPTSMAQPERLPHDGVFTRFGVGPHGIGVFAIRDIPDGTPLFRGDSGKAVQVPVEMVEALADPELRRLYFDFCPREGEAFLAPTSFDGLTMAWYLNHSPQPNVCADTLCRFSATTLIRKGEELVANYEAFSDHAHRFVRDWNR